MSKTFNFSPTSDQLFKEVSKGDKSWFSRFEYDPYDEPGSQPFRTRKRSVLQRYTAAERGESETFSVTGDADDASTAESTAQQLKERYSRIKEILSNPKQAKKNLYFKNESGTTALHIAACIGDHWAAKLIVQKLSQIADETAGRPIDEADSNAFTALHFACANGCLDVVKMLLANDASIEVQSRSRSTPLHAAAEGLSSRDKARAEDKTPTELDLDKTYAKIIVELIKAGANVDAKDNSGNTPLHLAVRSANRSAVVAFLDVDAVLAINK